MKKSVQLENGITWSVQDNRYIEDGETRWFFCYLGESDCVTVSRIYVDADNGRRELGEVKINWYGTGTTVKEAEKFSLLLSTAIEKAKEIK